MTNDTPPSAYADLTEERLREAFDAADYVAGDDVVTTVLLSLRLGKPLLVEGPPGAGKTDLAKVLAEGFDADLVRLQCYEGLAPEHALYEWNYGKQLLAVQSRTGDAADVRDEFDTADSDAPESVFSEEYLLERPLLRALRSDSDTPPVLLVDEIDRADEEFEALLLELLSDFQVSVPELGTVSADVPPVVVITSNRTRALSDALKRRCLYLHVEPPSFETEREIVRRKVPELDAAVASAVVAAVQRLREEPLVKRPGVAETLDWARALADLRGDGGSLDGSDGAPVTAEELRNTLGVLLKEVEDVEQADDVVEDVVAAATARASEVDDVD